MTKHIFITGGVVSSLGKGLASASLGMLLEARGLAIRMQKLDPYLNVDPSTMCPFQHGEVYVLDDGIETDLDLGHYERFTNSPLTKNSSWTAGKIYRNVLRRERSGQYRGQTVQIIPHITNEIKRAIRSLCAEDVDVVLTEIGGTVGDIESLPFLEAIRQFALDVGREHCLFLHLTLVPYLQSSGEIKTKPTQHSVGRLRQIGIQPDILVCRTEHSISESERDKIALLCNVEKRNVIESKDAADSIYEIPVTLQLQGLDQIIVDFLWPNTTYQRLPDLTLWQEMLERLRNPKHEVKIAVIGRYARHRDAYKSIYEALDHAGIRHQTKIRTVRMPSDKIDLEKLNDVAGILLPDDYGNESDPCQDGGDSRIVAVQYARERNIPFFGIGTGMQCAVIACAANAAGFNAAGFKPNDRPSPSHSSLSHWGATATKIIEGSTAFTCYKTTVISERCREHNYYNFDCLQLEQAGLRVAGTCPDGKFAAVIELREHPWFVGVQYHPEFKSQPTNPHPLFAGFVSATIGL